MTPKLKNKVWEIPYLGLNIKIIEIKTHYNFEIWFFPFQQMYPHYV